MAKVFTIAEASNELRICPSTLRNLIKMRKIGYKQKRSGEKILITEKDIDNYLSDIAHPSFKNNFDKGGIIVTSAKRNDRLKSGYFGYGNLGAIYVKGTQRNGEPSFYMWYRDENGKRHQEKVKGANCIKDAELKLQKKVDEIKHKKLYGVVEKSEIKFKDFVPVYIEEYAKVRKDSWKSDQKHLNYPLIPFFGEMFLSQIDSRAISEFVKKRKQNKIKKLDESRFYKDKISKKTINNELSLLRKMFKLAKKWDYKLYRNENPVDKEDFFKDIEKRDRILSEDEQQRLFRELPLHLKPIVNCALETGMRLREILHLKWKNVDLENSLITILPKDSKNRKKREVPISNTLNYILFELWSERENRKLNEYGKPEFRNYVFLYRKLIRVEMKKNKKSPIYKWVKIDNIRNAFGKALSREEINGFHFHDLRRTFATRLNQMEISSIMISRLMGHSSVNMTSHYTSISRPEKINAVNKLNGFNHNLLPKCYSDKKIIKVAIDSQRLSTIESIIKQYDGAIV